MDGQWVGVEHWWNGDVFKHRDIYLFRAGDRWLVQAREARRPVRSWTLDEPKARLLVDRLRRAAPARWIKLGPPKQTI